MNIFQWRIIGLQLYFYRWLEASFLLELKSIKSAASRDNRGLSISQLERALASMPKVSRSKNKVTAKASEFAQLLERSSDRNFVTEFPELTV